MLCDEIPRSVHGEWQPATDRPDPVDLLEQQAATRVSELVPIRYGRMLVSPFTFYRGAAYLMASDLAGTPRTPEASLPRPVCDLTRYWHVPVPESTTTSEILRNSQLYEPGSMVKNSTPKSAS
jgi:Uncharacterized protein conserved in bacteria (DUF2252)